MEHMKKTEETEDSLACFPFIQFFRMFRSPLCPSLTVGHFCVKSLAQKNKAG